MYHCQVKIIKVIFTFLRYAYVYECSFQSYLTRLYHQPIFIQPKDVTYGRYTDIEITKTGGEK
jgi:hypothetical protein